MLSLYLQSTVSCTNLNQNEPESNLSFSKLHQNYFQHMYDEYLIFFLPLHQQRSLLNRLLTWHLTFCGEEGLY